MKTQKQQGFTIIEVVLVLAIAGLIFLVVFLAVPALQRSQRDTQRRSDVGRVVSAVQSYRTNNKGNLPEAGAWDDFTDQYLTNNGEDEFSDPQTGSYTITENGANDPDVGEIFIHPGSVCGDGGDPEDAGDRNVAVRTTLESGGVYCASN